MWRRNWISRFKFSYLLLLIHLTSNFLVVLMPLSHTFSFYKWSLTALFSILARTFYALYERRISHKNKSLLCISLSESFHEKCKIPKTFNKFHVSKNNLCVDRAFKNLPFYQCSDSSDYFCSNDQLKFCNSCNSLEIISNKEKDIFKINSRYFEIKDFRNLDLNNNPLSLFHVYIACLKKYLDDLDILLNLNQHPLLMEVLYFFFFFNYAAK